GGAAGLGCALRRQSPALPILAGSHGARTAPDRTPSTRIGPTAGAGPTPIVGLVRNAVRSSGRATASNRHVTAWRGQQGSALASRRPDGIQHTPGAQPLGACGTPRAGNQVARPPTCCAGRLKRLIKYTWFAGVVPPLRGFPVLPTMMKWTPISPSTRWVTPPICTWKRR